MVNKTSAVVLASSLVLGCAWFQKNQLYLPTPEDIACVAGQVEAGVTDPVAVLSACPALVGLALADLEALITGQMKAKAARMLHQK
jgi:hypothetical protein